MKNNWYAMRALDDGGAEIDIYDEIGFWGVSAKDFRRDLLALGDVPTINLRINSPGGDVIDGFAIFNMLVEHPATVTAQVDGWAASMASIVAMAADKIVMPSNTWLMIHNPWTVAAGEADDLRSMADILDKMQLQGVRAYQRHATGLTTDDIIAHMDAETWMTGEDAVTMGYADELSDALEVAAKVQSRSLTNAPAEALVWAVADKPEPEEDDVPEPVEVAAEPVAVVEPDQPANDEPVEPEPVAAEPEDGPIVDDVQEVTPGDDVTDVVAWQEGYDARSREVAPELADLRDKVGELFGSLVESQREVQGYIESLEKKETALTELADQVQALIADVATLEDTRVAMEDKLARLTPAMGAPEDVERKSVETWKEALAACDGDDIVARKKYPDVYSAYRAECKERRSK